MLDSFSNWVFGANTEQEQTKSEQAEQKDQEQISTTVSSDSGTTNMTVQSTDTINVKVVVVIPAESQDSENGNVQKVHNLHLNPSMTGNELKYMTSEMYQKKPEEMTLWYYELENVSDAVGGNADNQGDVVVDASKKLLLIDDRKTLKNHGITPTTPILIQEGRDLGKPKHTDSELRANIHNKQQFSYYYAHATECHLPESTRYVSGGDPIPLTVSANGKFQVGSGNDQSNNITSNSNSNASGAKSDHHGTSIIEKPKYRTITTYSWLDENDYIKIYITDVDAVTVANLPNAVITPEYAADSVTLLIDYPASDTNESGQPRKSGFKFQIQTNKEIDPIQCKKYRVSKSKISLTLMKSDTDEKWYSLKTPTV